MRVYSKKEDRQPVPVGKFFNFKILYGLLFKDGVWLRFWNGYGMGIMKVKTHPLTFSQRNGLKKYYLIFGIKIIFLKPNIKI